MKTGFDAVRAAKKKFPKAPGEIITRTMFPGGKRACIIGMRAPLNVAIPGVTAFAILGQGATWREAIEDLDKRSALTPKAEA